MSFKDGIPLLTTLDDEDDEDAEEDLAVEVSSRSRYKWRRKHLLFAVVLALVVFVLVAIIVIVTVPLVALKSGGETATNGNNGESRSTVSPAYWLALACSTHAVPILLPTYQLHISL